MVSGSVLGPVGRGRGRGMGYGLTIDYFKERQDRGRESVKISIAHLRQVLERQIRRQIHYREMK